MSKERKKTTVIKALALCLLVAVSSIFMLSNNKASANNNSLTHGESIGYTYSATAPAGVTITSAQGKFYYYVNENGYYFLGTSDIQQLDFAEVIGGRTTITSTGDFNTITYLKRGVIKSVETIGTGTYFDVVKFGDYQFKVTTKAGIVLEYDDNGDDGMIQVYLSKVSTNNNNNNNNNNNTDDDTDTTGGVVTDGSKSFLGNIVSIMTLDKGATAGDYFNYYFTTVLIVVAAAAVVIYLKRRR